MKRNDLKKIIIQNRYTSPVILTPTLSPVFKFYGKVIPKVKNIWRCQITIIIVAAFIMITGIWKNEKFIRTLKGNVYLILSGMMLSGCQISFIACVWQTISFHAYILSSLPGILIILSKF